MRFHMSPKKTVLCRVLVLFFLFLFPMNYLWRKANYTPFPILMYHHITTDPSETNNITITDERFRLDMEFLQQFGYTALLPADVIEIQEKKQSAPEKPVMVTFDDGYFSNYQYAYPILRDTGMKAVIAVIGSNIVTEDKENRMFLKWQELREMRESGIIEVGSHTYNLHNPQYYGAIAPDGVNGVKRQKGESKAAYEERVGADLAMSIQQITENTGQAPMNFFAFPYGEGDRWIQPLLEENNVRMSVQTWKGKAGLTGKLYNLPRYGVKMEQSLSDILQETKSAKSGKLTVSIDGQTAELPAYWIDGRSYVRAGDAACLLRDTSYAFQPQWDETTSQTEINTQTPYQPTGNENRSLSLFGSIAHSTVEPTVIDGVSHMAAAYDIGKERFFNLTSLGELCGFAAVWDENAQCMYISTR